VAGCKRGSKVVITKGGASNLIVKLMLGSAALAMPTMVASAETYSYTTIDVPGSTLTSPSGINDSGAITGYYYGKSSSQYGFVYSGGITLGCESTRWARP
jgi:hypothetical protein